MVEVVNPIELLKMAVKIYGDRGELVLPDTRSSEDSKLEIVQPPNQMLNILRIHPGYYDREPEFLPNCPIPNHGPYHFMLEKAAARYLNAGEKPEELMAVCDLRVFNGLFSETIDKTNDRPQTGDVTSVFTGLLIGGIIVVQDDYIPADTVTVIQKCVVRRFGEVA